MSSQSGRQVGSSLAQTTHDLPIGIDVEALVHIAVAVVVHAVADLFGRAIHRRILVVTVVGRLTGAHGPCLVAVESSSRPSSTRPLQSLSAASQSSGAPG